VQNAAFRVAHLGMVVARCRREVPSRRRSRLQVSPETNLASHRRHRRKRIDAPLRSGMVRGRIRPSRRDISRIPTRTRRRRLTDVLVAPLTKAASTGVIRVLGREERGSRGVPNHLADRLDVGKMAVHPVVVEVRQRRDVVGLSPDTTGVEAVAQKHTGDGVGREFVGRRFPDRAGEKVDQGPERDPKTLNSPRP